MFQFSDKQKPMESASKATDIVKAACLKPHSCTGNMQHASAGKDSIKNT